MHVICSQMEDVVDCESNQHDNSDGLVGAELLTVPVHESDDAENDDCYAEDWYDTCDKVAGNKHQDEERETDRGYNTLESTFDESFLWWNVDPCATGLLHAFHLCWGNRNFLVNEGLPFVK